MRAGFPQFKRKGLQSQRVLEIEKGSGTQGEMVSKGKDEWRIQAMEMRQTLRFKVSWL